MLIPQLDNCSEVMAVVYRAALSRDVREGGSDVGGQGGGVGDEEVRGRQDDSQGRLQEPAESSIRLL